MYEKFIVYCDDGDSVYKLAIPAVSEGAARAWCNGVGEVIAVKNVTGDYHIDACKVSEALRNGGFSRTEIDFMVRALTELDLIE